MSKQTLQVFIQTWWYKAIIQPTLNPALVSPIGARPAQDWGCR
ncbi:MAG: hypothetical protein Q4F35_05495 [Akkermansia sp.]|nr:hypothetical protein [Akkermansia sp.]